MMCEPNFLSFHLIINQYFSVESKLGLNWLKNAIIGFFLVLSILPSNAQFQICQSPVTGNLNDVCFVDENIGIAVGDSGTILRTADGGIHWELISKNGMERLTKVKFFDSQYGIATGSTLYLSNDAGLTWVEQSRVNDMFFDVEITNDSTCVVSGTPSEILRSVDHGKTWEVLIDEKEDLGIQFLSFVNDKIGYANKFSGSVISSSLKTLDGGTTWSEIADGSGMHITLIEDIVFISEDVGFRGGWYSPHLMRTDNGAHLWSHIDSSLVHDFAIYDFHINPSQPNSFYACGWYGQVFKSIDGGATWDQLHTGLSTNTSLYGIYFTNDLNGWVVGQGGVILKTTNGGTVGTSQLAKSDDLNIQPNPVHNYLSVETKGSTKVLEVSIYDVNGILYKKDKSSEVYGLENLATGIYIVEIRTNKGMRIKKFSKQ